MKKTNFWNDAAKYGALVALAAIVFNVLGLLMPSLSWLWVISLAVYLYLIYIFTKRRATICGTPDGYTYGQCFGFIVAMALFAGFLLGVWQIVAAKWIFVEQYAEMSKASLSMLANTGLYTADQLEMIVSMLKSPLMMILGSILGAVIKGAFFGLFVAAFTKREPDVFAQND